MLRWSLLGWAPTVVCKMFAGSCRQRAKQKTSASEVSALGTLQVIRSAGVKAGLTRGGPALLYPAGGLVHCV